MMPAEVEHGPEWLSIAVRLCCIFWLWVIGFVVAVVVTMLLR